MEIELHSVQADILVFLLFNPKSRFKDLNTTGMSTDHFNFHVRRLVEHGLIRKTGSLYSLTKKGKKFANRFDTKEGLMEKQAKISVLVCCTKKIKDKTYFLMQKRLKEPYFGYLGMITGKVQWGETILQAAARELKEETGLRGKGKLKGVEHNLDYQKKGKLLEDKYFFVVRINNPKGRLKKKIEGGKNLWMSEKEVAESDKLFADVFEILKIIRSESLSFIESKYEVSDY